MKQEASFFEGHDPILVYIAKKLKDALRLESIFTESGLDYGVEADEYRGGVIFRSIRAGAGTGSSGAGITHRLVDRHRISGIAPAAAMTGIGGRR